MISNHLDRFWVEIPVSVVLLYKIVKLIAWDEVDGMSKDIFADVRNFAALAAKLRTSISNQNKILVIYKCHINNYS